MKLLTVVTLVLTLAACAAPREMPRNGNGTDEMKLSPCACDPIPFNSEGYRWVG